MQCARPGSSRRAGAGKDTGVSRGWDGMGQFRVVAVPRISSQVTGDGLNDVTLGAPETVILGNSTNETANFSTLG